MKGPVIYRLTHRFGPLAMGLLLCCFLALGCETEDGGDTSALQQEADEVPQTPHVVASSPVEAGRYLVVVGGCNDCHTPGYMETEGKIPEEDWLTGSPIGWRGPWGTTYPANLRLRVEEMSEDEWVNTLRFRTTNPPMPWMNVNKLSESDSRAIYQFIRSLGSAGERMPASAKPEDEPHTPYILMEPQHLERLQQLVRPDTTSN